MISSKVRKILYNYRRLIYASFASSLIGLALSSMFPIPWIATVDINNSEGFFNIQIMKRIKARMPTQIIQRKDGINDKNLDQALNKIINYPFSEWIEKNINPTYAITKSDAKDLIEGVASNTSDGLKISSVNIRVVDMDKTLAEKAAKFIADYITSLSFRENYIDFLHTIRSENESALLDIEGSIPELVSNVYFNRLRIQNLHELIDRSVNDDKNRDLTSANNRISSADFLYQLGDHVEYLPPKQQLNGIELNQQHLITKLEVTNFKRELLRELNIADNMMARKMEDMPNSISLSQLEYNSQFWRTSKILSFFEDKSIDWKKDITKSYIAILELKKDMFNARSERQIRNISIYAEPQYKRWIISIGFFTLGLILPSFLTFGAIAVLTKLDQSVRFES